jgi:hypothetical protein
MDTGTLTGGGGGKAAGREADHSHPSSDEVKNGWSYASVLQYIFIVWYLSEGTTLPYLYLTNVIMTTNPLKMGVESSLET